MTEIEGVVPALAQALAKRGYETLTPVQQAVLGAEMEGADALVSAQTGSGKTVAFGLAIAPTLLEGAERLPRADLPVALAVAPTRELALQVKRELDWLYEFAGASVASCVGGMDMRTERMTLSRGAHIVVGTPGRLRDHIERGSLDMSAMKVVVLDEADEMLDLGFREDLEFILQSAPVTRRTLMFSATVPPTIASMAKRYQRDAVRLSTAGESRQHGDIEYRALVCAPTDRENAIINVLRHANPKSAIVFCGTRATVNHLTSRFTNRGLSVVALSGELNQGARTHALQALRDGRASVCIATDVAARGIDLPNLELVIHADLPKNPESLLHRSGRTGRAGRKGISALIVPYPRRRHTERLLANASIKATWGKPPSADEVLALDRQRMLDDGDLAGETTEEEQAFAVELLAKYDAQAVAIAFLRKHMAGLTAPEELLDGPAGGERHERPERGRRDDRGDRGDRGPRQDRGRSERDRPERDRPERDRGERGAKRPGDFGGGTWIRLSVGRHHSAEARWLLPMLCRAGNLTKNHVGAIRIHDNETHVELHPDAASAFLEAVGPSRKIEKSITVDKIEGLPVEPAAVPRKERPERAPRKPKPQETKPKPQETKPKPQETTPKPQGTLRAAAPKPETVTAEAPAAPAPAAAPPAAPSGAPAEAPVETPAEAPRPDRSFPDRSFKEKRRREAPTFKRETVNPAERPLKRRRDGAQAPAGQPVAGPVDATPIATAEDRGPAPKKAWKGKDGPKRDGPNKDGPRKDAAGKGGKKFGRDKFNKPHPAKTRLGLDKPKKPPHRKGSD